MVKQLKQHIYSMKQLSGQVTEIWMLEFSVVGIRFQQFLTKVLGIGSEITILDNQCLVHTYSSFYLKLLSLPRAEQQNIDGTNMHWLDLI